MHITRSVFLGVLATGCVEQAPVVRETEQHGEASNGTSFNGIALNGIALNGISLNGISLNGISLNGISLNGISLNGIALNGIALNGISLNGISLNGTDLTGVVGSTWTGVLSNGAPLPLRIDSAIEGTGANADVGMFEVSYESELGWQPLCGHDAAGTPIRALVVPGTWDFALGTSSGGRYTPSDDLVTFACRGKSIAKCVELGYKPWNGGADHLATCVRLLRSDFCGDGTAYTVDGNQVNLYDALGIQTDTMAWSVEAEWTPAGARCISYARMTRFQASGGLVPPCAVQLSRGGECGTFANGALLVDEIPAPTLTTKITTTTRLR